MCTANLTTHQKPFAGEEIDWYCCIMGHFHMERALDPSVPTVQSEQLRRYLLLEDSVLFQQAALTLGASGLKTLAAEYVAKGENWAAAKAKYAEVQAYSAAISGSHDILGLMKDAHECLGKSGRLATTEGQQLVGESVSQWAFAWGSVCSLSCTLLTAIRKWSC